MAAEMSKRVYIQTVGCQMNVLDSELAAADLLAAGYELVDTTRQADLILFNTCSVRQHAEDKIYSALGRLKRAKAHRPNLIIGVLGCMAQKDQEKIFRRAPHVDLVVGPGQLRQLPALIERVRGGAGRIIEVSLARNAASRAEVRQSFNRVGSRLSPHPNPLPQGEGTGNRPHAGHLPTNLSAEGGVPGEGNLRAKYDPHRTAAVRGAPHQALVRIMFGCDKFCTYCIVPSVRGPEQCRPADEIVEEARRLAHEGCLEITLLGQTVNSYNDATSGRTVRLADLLARLSEIKGIERLKFVTNYPKHVTDDLLAAVRDLPKVSPYLHVPAQSGSTAVLKRMKRGYTAEEYCEMLARIRETIPGTAVTSDFIVGFCGETEEDFQQTVDLVRLGRFKNSFIFKYSPRPGTKAAELYEDDVPEAVKRRRNNELLAVQNAVSLEENLPFVGRTVEILVEGPSKVGRKKAAAPEDGQEDDSAVQLLGRTVCDRIVVFDGRRELTGKILPVRIEKADAFTLFATVLNG
jgi:tRNA-2-methylthio-N6-dimethylallyladenosine synthase